MRHQLFTRLFDSDPRIGENSRVYQIGVAAHWLPVNGSMKTMTPAETESFRSRLEQQRADLQAQIASLQVEVGGVAADTDEPSDEGDQAKDIISVEENSAQIGLLQTVLAQVEKALGRIADGSYGISEVSGRPIPIERLEALPYATTLVDEEAPAV
jgi:DnaK suppressor protein